MDGATEIQAEIGRIEELMQSGSATQQQKLSLYCARQALRWVLDGAMWVAPSVAIMGELPVSSTGIHGG